ncbi:FixH family protein [Psychrobacter lutiphocae]|uniref:FixH family protein n=1 Tax=Psychrobacter lutiphocae TaxID=540500 RepID=UPI00036A2076|nr:FixH family protein [Psychrobacter lutiphocae]
MKNSKSTTNFGHQDTQPWYKNYMVMVFVIGLPLFVVVACIWFVFYSVQIKDTVVRDDWYMDGKTLYQDVSRDKLAHDLGLSGDMLFKKDGQVIFSLNYPEDSLEAGKLHNGMPVEYPEQLSLSISHATDIKKDRDATLTHNGGNQYMAQVELDPLESKYYVEVSNEGEVNWRLKETAQLPQAEIHLQPLQLFDKK